MSTQKMRNIYKAYKADLAVATEKIEEHWQHETKVAAKELNELMNAAQASHDQEVINLNDDFDRMFASQAAIIEEQRQEIDQLQTQQQQYLNTAAAPDDILVLPHIPTTEEADQITDDFQLTKRDNPTIKFPEE